MPQHPAAQPLIVFSDVDGCLLDKQDYSYQPALPVLARLRACEIPLILASSKTGRELRELAAELQLDPAPLICENGGQILWPADDAGQGTPEPTILGAPRSQILDILQSLKPRFQFRSFADLGLAGVMQATQLPAPRAAAALDRHCTEPLLWDDSAQAAAEFAAVLHDHQLSFTRGGRFWHVAGTTSKGQALQQVRQYFSEPGQSLRTAAVGDSPIDQSMLDLADFPIVIPTPTLTLDVTVRGDHWIIASAAGPTGWAESVASVLDRLGFPN